MCVEIDFLARIIHLCYLLLSIPCETNTSDVNKELTFKAKAKAKDSGFKAKAKAKDSAFKAKAKAKDRTFEGLNRELDI